MKIFRFCIKNIILVIMVKKVMTPITMVKKTNFTFPTERYLNVVKRGYKGCELDKEFLEKALLAK